MKFDLSQIKLSKNDIKRGLVLPKTCSKELAEFIGILTGDGYINFDNRKYSYIIEIAGDKTLDKNYLEKYVINLINKLFNIGPKIYIKKNQNTMYVRILSKGIFNYLLTMGFKRGKKEQISTPKWILDNKKFMVSFIKGLADTDFSLMLSNKPSKISKYYPTISLKIKSRVLVKEVGHFLKRNGFKINVIKDEIKKDKRGYKDSVTSSLILSGRENLERWMKEIRFRNKRHLNKYKEYIGSTSLKKKWDGRKCQHQQALLNPGHSAPKSYAS